MAARWLGSTSPSRESARWKREKTTVEHQAEDGQAVRQLRPTVWPFRRLRDVRRLRVRIETPAHALPRQVNDAAVPPDTRFPLSDRPDARGALGVPYYAIDYRFNDDQRSYTLTHLKACPDERTAMRLAHWWAAEFCPRDRVVFDRATLRLVDAPKFPYVGAFPWHPASEYYRTPITMPAKPKRPKKTPRMPLREARKLAAACALHEQHGLVEEFAGENRYDYIRALAAFHRAPTGEGQ